MRTRSAIIFALLLVVPLIAAAQSPEDPFQPLAVSVCDLRTEPAKYNGKLVRIRGQISFAFEDFSLFDKDCPRFSENLSERGIWLEYGGDESTPAIYCCGDHSRKEGQVIEVQGKRIPLLRDEQRMEFRRRLVAMRQSRPDGQPCYDRECYLYDVTATITGHFFAMKITKESIAGYGHMGCCHLLFIEQVTDLDAKRTQVAAGGIFNCKQEDWVATGTEAEAALSDYQKCHDAKCFENSTKQIVKIGAMHFGESPEQVERWNAGGGGGNEESESCWSSAGLMTTLCFKFPYTNSYIHTSRKELVVARKICAVQTKPLPQSTKMSCETGYWDAKVSEADARIAQLAVDQGADRWRLDVQKVAWNAVQDYAKKHSIALSSNLLLKNCDSRENHKDLYAQCSLISQDGMQSVWVTLIRYDSLKSRGRPKEKTIWVLRSAMIAYCRPE